MTKLNVNSNQIRIRCLDTYTSGQVGAKVEFRFSPDWDTLHKTAVFEAHEPKRRGDCCVVSSVVLESHWDGDVCRVPADVLAEPGYELWIGVYGVDSDGKLVIPTVYANCGLICRGAQVEGSGETPDPPLPIWGQLQADIGNLSDLTTSDKSSLVAAINEAAQSGGGGGSGGASPAYVHSQNIAANEWVINHNLNKFPSVTIVDSGGSVVVGDVQYLSMNKISVSFAGAFSGKAYLN